MLRTLAIALIIVLLLILGGPYYAGFTEWSGCD